MGFGGPYGQQHSYRSPPRDPYVYDYMNHGPGRDWQRAFDARGAQTGETATTQFRPDAAPPGPDRSHGQPGPQ